MSAVVNDWESRIDGLAKIPATTLNADQDDELYYSEDMETYDEARDDANYWANCAAGMAIKDYMPHTHARLVMAVDETDIIEEVFGHQDAEKIFHLGSEFFNAIDDQKWIYAKCLNAQIREFVALAAAALG